MVLRVALRVLKDETEAHDACQEVFMRVMRSFHTYDPTRPLAPWIARISYNVCLRRIEQRSRRSDLPNDEPADDLLVAASNATPEQAASRSESAALLEQALGRLPEQDRMLLVLRYRDDISESELSEVADMPVGTIKTRLHRARQKLKTMLYPSLGKERP